MNTGRRRRAALLAAGLAGLTGHVCAEPPARFIIVTTTTSRSGQVSRDEAIVADLDKHLVARCYSQFQLTNGKIIAQPCDPLPLVGSDETSDWHGEQWQPTPVSPGIEVAHWYHINPKTGDLTSCYDHAANRAAFACATVKADLSK